MNPRTRVPVVAEKVEQQHGVQLLQTIGAGVYVLGTTRRKGDYQGTNQTPGISDVIAILPKQGDLPREILFWECKSEHGRLRAEQAIFRDLCQETTAAHVVGPFDALIAFLVARGYCRANSFPHYRQPAGSTSGRV